MQITAQPGPMTAACGSCALSPSHENKNTDISDSFVETWLWLQFQLYHVRAWSENCLLSAIRECHGVHSYVLRTFYLVLVLESTSPYLVLLGTNSRFSWRHVMTRCNWRIIGSLQKRVLEWYHTTLLHPGINRTEETIRQHLWWSTIRQDVLNYVSKCDTCQRFKKQKKKYGHLPVKEAESEPWERLSVDLIGPYKIERKSLNLC